MLRARKKIFLLLAGGTWLLDKNQHLLSIQEATDIEPWLQVLPELSIMADLQPIFIQSEADLSGPAIWETMASSMIKYQAEADGFIVINRLEQLHFTASALAFLLPNFGKNIILTASYLSGIDWAQDKDRLVKIKAKHSGLGLKSNLINAIQALDHPLPQPAIMFGTRLLPGLRSIFGNDNDLNLFSSADDSYWGRVDFGVNIKANLPTYKINLPNFNKIQANVLLLDNVLALPINLSKVEAQKYQAIIIKAEPGTVLEPEKFEKIKTWQVPTVLYNFEPANRQNGLLVVNNCTWPAIVTKTMWLAANTKSRAEFDKLLAKNLLGEYFYPVK